MKNVIDYREKASNFLNTHPVGVLSTAGTNGQPWGATVYFYSESDFRCFFVIRSETLKAKNIKQNQNVSLTVADSITQETLQMSGTARPVAARETFDTVFNKIASVYPTDKTGWSPPVMKVHEGDWQVYELRPDYVQYADFLEAKTDPFDKYLRCVYPAD